MNVIMEFLSQLYAVATNVKPGLFSIAQKYCDVCAIYLQLRAHKPPQLAERSKGLILESNDN